MRLSLRGRRATTAVMAATIAAVGVLSSACAAAPATKVISGTIKGADGNVVDVMIGFDVVDSAGHKLDLGYINAGYSSIQRLNHCVPVQGTTAVGTCPATVQYGQKTAAQQSTYNWSLRVPGNAAQVYIEVYPKAPTPNNWVSYRGYTGPMPGTTNMSKYGMAYRRAIPLPASRSGVQIVLPKVCSAGGTTGTLVGHVNGWPGGTGGSIYAWSMAADQPTMGFGIGTVDGNGNYRIDNLQAGQRYGVQAQGGNFFRAVVDYRRATSNDTLIAGQCQTKAFNF